MKYVLTCIIVFSGFALAQNPKQASFAPLVGFTHYVLDGETTTGPTLGLQ